MSGNEKLERELEAFLAEENSRVAALYRNLSRREPDATLDASVLAMARNAVAPKRPRNRWLPALSAAAVVLIVAGVAYRSGPQVWNQRAAPAAQPIGALDEARSAAKPSPLPAAPAPPPAQEVAPAMSAGSAVNTPKPSFVPSPAEPQARRKTAEGARLPPPAAARQVVAQPASASTATTTDAERAVKPEASVRDAPMASPDAAAFPKDLQKQQANDAMSVRIQGDVAPLSTESRSDAAKTESAPPPAAAAAPAMKFAPGQRLYPEHWISNIRTLLRENRRDEAIRDLVEFRRQYPDYALPDDLHDLK
jgi:hypothetical protein